MPSRVGLGEFELLVLAAVLRLGGDAYGSAIARELERVGRSVSIGAVYTTLARLEDKKLLRSRAGEPTPVRGGRARRYYRVEARGEAELSASMGRFASLLDGTSLSFT